MVGGVWEVGKLGARRGIAEVRGSGISKMTGSATFHNILQSKKRKEAGANKKGWKPGLKGTGSGTFKLPLFPAPCPQEITQELRYNEGVY